MAETLSQAERHQKRLEQYMGTCRHFNGGLNDACKAGIRYDEVRQGGPIPCLMSIVREGRVVGTCPKREWTSADEAESQITASDAAATEFLCDLAEDRCPHCKTAIAAYDKVGRCVYAHPCGHRLYQGSVPDGKPTLARRRESATMPASLFDLDDGSSEGEAAHPTQ